MTARAPNTFIVGAGAVATALAGGLRHSSVPVLGLWARRADAARRAASAGGVAAYSSAPPDLLLEAEVVILAVRDDAVGEVAARLCGTGLVGSHHVLLHCGGATAAADAFAAVAGKVGAVGTLHPLRAIPADSELARVRGAWKGTVFGVEGDPRGRAAAEVLARALGGDPLALDGAAMASYHAAAAIASNYAVAVLDAAVALLTSAGLAPSAALAALAPLTQGAIASAAQHGLADGLTGPIRRGDAGTVERHLAAVAGDAELTALYKVLGRRTLALARPHLDEATASSLAALLG